VIVARSPYQGQEGILHAAGVRHVICDERETARALLPLLIATIEARHGTSERVERTRQTLRNLASPATKSDPTP